MTANATCPTWRYIDGVTAAIPRGTGTGRDRPELHRIAVKTSTARLFFACYKQARTAARRCPHPVEVCLDPPVAVLVFLPRAAGTVGGARRARIDPGIAA